MTSSHRTRYGGEAARDTKWRMAAPPVPLLNRGGGAPQPPPVHLHPMRLVQRSHFPPPPPQLPLFHTRHAEESAERPHLVTIIRPRGESTLRKVTVLLNRRGVVSFKQLLLDISEALGFPHWHRAKVTRLYTTHAREVKGVCDFFRGEVAFLALGKVRPELSDLQEALEELFPEHSHYRADALQAWEKRLRPAPDKAAKADSGYSEGTESNKTHTDQETCRATNRHVKNDADSHTCTYPPHHVHTHQSEHNNSDVAKCHKNNSYRKPAHLPNHLQRLRVRGGARERHDAIVGPFNNGDSLREADVASPTLCEECLARRVKRQLPEWLNPLTGRAPLPPVSRKQSLYTQPGVKQFDARTSPPPLRPISRHEEKSEAQFISNPLPKMGEAHNDIRERTTFDLPSNEGDVTLAEIEHFYEIGHVVGDGNFAVVRKCRRRDNGQTLAVKIVERSKLIGREHMMQNELSLLGSLCHPRIVRLFSHHHTHTHSYLVMELVSGGDLFEAISERGKFPEAESGLMVSDVSEALNYMHCKSIVHRDLKPENLLIEHVAPGICRLKLADFGLAMVVTEPVFTICGTPTYVAPEILRETGYGVEVDVWALGIILYILLCGFPPFRSQDRDQDELFRLIKQGELHFLPPYWDAVSEDATGLVRALLQPDPTVRLTAQQTMTHPWVKAVALICRQRALTEETRRDTADTGAEPDMPGLVQRPAQTNVAKRVPQGTPEGTSSEVEVTQTNTGRRQDEDGSPWQHSVETSAANAISPQLKVNTVNSEAETDQQKSECTSTDSGSSSRELRRPEIKGPGPTESPSTITAIVKLDQPGAPPSPK
ncbi:serine/threonine-protein kinase DCLK3 [Spinachia spinachia]